MNKSQKKFADRILKEAYEAKANSGLPASILAAQAILETGWGKSIPKDMYTKQYSYNLFGIKCTRNSSGKIVVMGTNGCVLCRTEEYINNKMIETLAHFRAYNNYVECFEDYAKVIKNSTIIIKIFGIKRKIKRYRNALTKKALKDPRKYIYEIWKAGYATDPNYVGKIISIAENCGFISKEK